jgi:hypothetical protein
MFQSCLALWWATAQLRSGSMPHLPLPQAEKYIIREKGLSQRHQRQTHDAVGEEGCQCARKCDLETWQLVAACMRLNYRCVGICSFETIPPWMSLVNRNPEEELRHWHCPASSLFAPRRVTKRLGRGTEALCTLYRVFHNTYFLPGRRKYRLNQGAQPRALRFCSVDALPLTWNYK